MNYLVLTALLLASTRGLSQSITFAPPLIYGNGLATASGLAVQDVNGDGRPDLIVANDLLGTVSIRLNTGTGAFAATTTSYSSGTTRVDAMAVGDVNADGKADIAIINKYSYTLGILLGTSTGTFQPVIQYPLPSTTVPTSIMLVDVNSDGRADALVLGSYYSLGVMLSLSTGGFAPSMPYDGTLTHMQSVAVADMNADSNPDLIFGGSAVSILLGNGTGQFTPNLSLYSPGTTATLQIQPGDINNDGMIDIVAVNSGTATAPTSTANILLGTGTGSLGAPSTYSTGYLAYSNSVALSDLNKDGRLDIITNSYALNSVGVLLGQLGGGFPATATQFSTGNNSSPFKALAADVNGDTMPDIITFNPGTGTVSVLLNTTVLAAASAHTAASLSLYPNPSLHAATLSGATAGAQVQVYNLLGGLVLATQANAAGTATLVLPTSLPGGLYLVRSGAGPVLRLTVE